MFEVSILALALSMDAFAVSIGLGAKHLSRTSSLPIMAGVYFGLFQGVMPMLGYAGGIGLLGWIQDYAPWVAFILLLLIGGKMIYESFAEGIEDDIAQITHRVMLMLAIATSIDALAAGFSLTLLEVDAFFACFIIGAVTALFSAVGVKIGAKSGTWLESRAELFGGIVLILIGFKMLIF
ncbi:manganese efflux pump MntP [Alteromonas sp. a30]|uniref:manganese efflux pump MntP n=1 Tax=Alteromonas sp. a30 TaxID=2730917 RepID=UPI002282D525|nr:manganese efflux pump MntP family protein [Alteromonas sp. a30]MCY7296647.1 manganese efflux pump [Alteromonas sp. a30]